MPCGNGRLLYPDANTDYVRTLVLSSQVILQIYQILITVVSTYERFLLCVALVPLLQFASAVLGLKQQS